MCGRVVVGCRVPCFHYVGQFVLVHFHRVYMIFCTNCENMKRKFLNVDLLYYTFDRITLLLLGMQILFLSNIYFN